MLMAKKEFYTSPEIDVFECRIEGVVCQSTGDTTINDLNDGITITFDSMNFENDLVL